MDKIVGLGWRSRTGVLLNMQCVTCQVWVGEEKRRLIEFDGLPHQCPKSYRKLSVELGGDDSTQMELS